MDGTGKCWFGWMVVVDGYRLCHIYLNILILHYARITRINVAVVVVGPIITYRATLQAQTTADIVLTVIINMRIVTLC